MFIHNWTCWNWLDRYSGCISRWMNTFRKKKRKCSKHWSFPFKDFWIYYVLHHAMTDRNFFKKYTFNKTRTNVRLPNAIYRSCNIDILRTFSHFIRFFLHMLIQFQNIFSPTFSGAFKMNIRDTYFWMNQSCVTKKVVAQDFSIMFFFFIWWIHLNLHVSNYDIANSFI